MHVRGVLHQAGGQVFTPPLSGSLEVGHPQKSRTWRQLPAAEVVPRGGSCLCLQHCQSWAAGPQCRGLVHSSYLTHIYNFVLGSSRSWKIDGSGVRGLESPLRLGASRVREMIITAKRTIITECLGHVCRLQTFTLYLYHLVSSYEIGTPIIPL